MRVLITGITGFVGPYMKDILEKEEFEVFGTTRQEKNVNDHVFLCDICDKENVFEVIKNSKPDFIFHLAAQSSPRKSYENPEDTHQTNVEGTRNILEAMHTHASQAKILLVSSVEVYGKPTQVPIPETATLSAVSPYGKSKIDEEKLMDEFPELHIIIARSFNHTGPGQSPHFVMPDFASQIAAIEQSDKEPVFFKGNTEVIRDFTDVRDIVSAYLLLLQKSPSHEIYNVGSGHGYLLDDLVTLFVSLAAKDIEIQVDPARIRPVDIPSLIADISKLQSVTRWEPKIPMEQTLRDLLEYTRKHR